jgi:hypothetical protein
MSATEEVTTLQMETHHQTMAEMDLPVEDTGDQVVVVVVDPDQEQVEEADGQTVTAMAIRQMTFDRSQQMAGQMETMTTPSATVMSQVEESLYRKKGLTKADHFIDAETVQRNVDISLGLTSHHE